MADTPKSKRTTRRVVRTTGGKATVVNYGEKPTAHLTQQGHWSRFKHIVNPKNFKEEWLSRAGAVRTAKTAGAGFLLMVLVFIGFGYGLPSPDKINARVSAQTTKFYDRTGNTLLYEVYGDKNRSIVTFDQMSPNIKHATVAIEDKNFYKHGAFSSIGILRAAFVDVFHKGSGIQGGSTITQQYVKNALLTDNRSIVRKIRELILSIEIEQLYKKDDILKLYLNEIPYGSQAYGIQAASKTYFQKNATDLTIDEAALLAAIPQAPTYYSPYGQHQDALVARQHTILDQMADQRYITKDEADAAKKIDTLAKIPPTQNLYSNIIAPHFVLDVQEQLEAKYGSRTVNEGGYKVITTLDIDKQKMAEDAIAKNIKSVRSFGGSNAAMVVSEPKTGQVEAMVGSYSFGDVNFGAYNVAEAARQPGSSFKPFAYATAMKKTNFGAGTTLYDVTTDFGNGYKPRNYSGTTYGVQSARTSLANSLNIPSVKTLYLAGIKETLQTAHDMGITTLDQSPDQYGLSLVLGSGEVKLADMTNAYGGFANNGTNVPQAFVLKMTDPKGNVKEEYRQPVAKRVLDPQIAYIISNMLSDNNARKLVFGNYSPLIIPGHVAAVKTGTTEDYRDAWTVGYTPSLVAGVWAGNNDNRSMTKAASAVSAPIWHDFMVAALADKPDEPFKQPDGVKQVTLDANTGKLATDSTKIKRTDIFPSWYKPATALDSKSAKVDKVSGKLATDCTPPLAVIQAVSSEMHAEIPYTDPAYSRWEAPVAGLAASLGYGSGGSLPTDNDNVHSCSDAKPTVNLTVQDKGSGNYVIKADYTSGTFPVNKVDFFLGDQLISTNSANGGNGTISFPYAATSNGSYTLKAVATDGGLYQAEDAQTVVVVGAGNSNSFTGNSPTSDQAHGNTNFTWDSFAGASKYRLSVRMNGNDIGGGPFTVTAPLTSRVVNVPAGPISWYVEALNGNTLIGTTPVINYYAN
jgi:penicillin-binding protein 1C